MITSALELVRAKVREVEALDAEIATLTRKREGIVGELAQVRAELGADVQPVPLVRSTPPQPHRESQPASHVDAPLSAQVTHDIDRINMALAASDAPMNYTEIGDATGIGGARLGYLLDVMRRRGMLESTGIRRGMRYRLPSSATPASAKPRIPLPGPDPNLEAAWSGAAKRSVITGAPLDNPPPNNSLARRGPQGGA